MDAFKPVIGIDHQVVLIEGLDLIVLILEIEKAVIVLKGPEERQAVRIGVLVPGLAFPERAGAVRPEDDGIVFLETYDTRVQGIKAGAILIFRIKSGFFVFPGCMCQEVHIMAGSAITAAQRKAGR